MLIDSLVRGGAQRQLVELALNLSRANFAPTVVVYHDLPQLKGDLDAGGVRNVLIRKRAKLDPAFLVRLVRFLSRERPDIVHAFLNTPTFWARLAATIAGVPTIITSERNIDIMHSRKRMLLERWMHPLSSKIIVNADAIRHILVTRLRVPPGKVVVIHNGVDVDKFASASPERIAAIRARLGMTGDHFVLTLPGRLARQKNHGCLVEAVACLPNVPDNLRILFVGNELDLKLKRTLIARIGALGLARHFVFGDRQDDMPAIYAASNAVVLPSLWEGFPNVLLEAMAARRPVIASDIADNRRIVDDRRNGYLFPSNDPKALAEAISELLALGPDERAALGEAGRARVEARFSMAQMVRQTIEVYQKLG